MVERETGTESTSLVVSEPAAVSPRKKLAPEWLALFFIWAVLAGSLIWQAYRVGITADEPSHLVSSSLYWKGNDILLPRDMPPLIKIASGLMPATRQLPIPTDKIAWHSRSEWQVALEVMLNLPKPSIQQIFFQARLPLIVFPILTTLIVFLWARELFGPVAGVAAAFLFAFEPTALGHGSLVKNDHAAAFGYAFFWYRAWGYWKNPERTDFALLVLATGLAIMAKLSLVIGLLIAPVVILLREPRWRQAAIRTALLVAGVYAILLATSWFDIRVLHQADLDKLKLYRNVPGWLSIAAWPFQFLPVPFFYYEGVLSLLGSHGDGSPVYLLGRVVEHGTPWYFPIAFALKSPVALQILLAIGLISLCIAVGSGRLALRDALFLLLPPSLYIACASLVSMQLGFRLILPALPFGAMLGVCCLLLCRKRQHALPFLILVAAVGFTSARSFDVLIGYFNEWAGERNWATYYLANSNVDWGQDLPALNRWYRATKPGKVRLFYFGMDNSDRFFTEEEVERMPTPWNMELIKSNRYQPEPGWYAISVNQLRGPFFAEGYRDYLAAFRAMTPVAYAGASIFIYKVP